MADYLVRAIGASGNVRAFAATTTLLVDEARRRHDTWPTATAALGRTLTATALLSATLKDGRESVTVRIDSKGPAGGIICDGDEQGQVRGYVRNPHVDLDLKEGKLDVAGLVGEGEIHVTRHLALQGVYTGSAALISGEIAEDVAYYLTQSEQTPSAVALGVRIGPSGMVTAAGGYLIQLLPSVSDTDREQLEVNIGALGAVSKAVEDGLSPEEILRSVLAGLDHKILEQRDLHFACRCSRQKGLQALATLDPDDLEQMRIEDRGAEMSCHFCGEVYQYTEADLMSLHSPG